MMKSQKPLTIVNLAQQLGVSTATVSTVLNNRHAERRISSETVRRIQEAARTTGYLPNLAARHLGSKRGHSQIIIAIITSFEAPLPLISGALTAVQKVNQETAYKDLSVATTVDMFHAGRLRELPALLDGSHFNAAVIANTLPEDDHFLAHHPMSVPVVLIGRDIPNYSSVRDMPEATGAQAAEILWGTGSRRMAVLRPELLTQSTLGRVQGFSRQVQILTGHPPVEIICRGFTAKDACEAMSETLSKSNPIDSLYSVMDPLAIGAYYAIKEKGLQIPHDIAVIGTGDYPESPYLDPPLSTFNQSQYNMHEEAMRLLFRQLTGELSRSTQIVIPVIPVLRASTQRRPENHHKERNIEKAQ